MKIFCGGFAIAVKIFIEAAIALRRRENSLAPNTLFP